MKLKQALLDCLLKACGLILIGGVENANSKETSCADKHPIAGGIRVRLFK